MVIAVRTSRPYSSSGSSVVKIVRLRSKSAVRGHLDREAALAESVLQERSQLRLVVDDQKTRGDRSRQQSGLDRHPVSTLPGETFSIRTLSGTGESGGRDQPPRGFRLAAAR